MKRQRALTQAFYHVHVCAWCNYISSIVVRYVGVHHFEVPTCKNLVSMVNKTYQWYKKSHFFYNSCWKIYCGLLVLMVECSSLLQ